MELARFQRGVVRRALVILRQVPARRRTSAEIGQENGERPDGHRPGEASVRFPACPQVRRNGEKDKAPHTILRARFFTTTRAARQATRWHSTPDSYLILDSGLASGRCRAPRRTRRECSGHTPLRDRTHRTSDHGLPDPDANTRWRRMRVEAAEQLHQVGTLLLVGAQRCASCVESRTAARRPMPIESPRFSSCFQDSSAGTLLAPSQDGMANWQSGAAAASRRVRLKSEMPRLPRVVLACATGWFSLRTLVGAAPHLSAPDQRAP